MSGVHENLQNKWKKRLNKCVSFILTCVQAQSLSGKPLMSLDLGGIILGPSIGNN